MASLFGRSRPSQPDHHRPGCGKRASGPALRGSRPSLFGGVLLPELRRVNRVSGRNEPSIHRDAGHADAISRGAQLFALSANWARLRKPLLTAAVLLLCAYDLRQHNVL